MKKSVAVLALSAFSLGTFAQTVPVQDSTKKDTVKEKKKKADTTKVDTLRKA